MPIPAAPFKTPLGLDELRHRTHGLGQRHRTVLLLVDGRRPLGEVLGMAHRAGASTSHFEELVRLGLVEVPVEPAQETPETAPGALEQARLTSVEVEVPTAPEAAREPSAPSGSPPSPQDEGPETEGNPDVAAMSELETVVAPSPPVAPAPPEPWQPLPKRAAWLPFRTPSTVPTEQAHLRQPDSEDQLRQQVRTLLIGALGAEAALFSPLTLTRIRAAQTPRDLIALVWDMERQHHRVRRSRARLSSLQQARELLGMGNTLVAGDSQTGAVWPDTVGR